MSLLETEVANLGDESLEVANAVNSEGVSWGQGWHEGHPHALMLIPRPERE